MARVFHAGELAVQRQAGVHDRATRVAASIRSELPSVAGAFLEQRRWVVLATSGADERPWASIVTGAPGFASSPDPGVVRIAARPLPGSPLEGSLGHASVAGLLAIDLAARRRLRVNGRIHGGTEGPIDIEVDQAYSNCPKYIQRRVEEGPPGQDPIVRLRATGLNDRQRRWIEHADTFFIASLHPGEGADASHRGGMPGFVRVEGDRLVWPEYAGNAMYNTLGNLAVHPMAGLTFPDFQSGAVLQLTGSAAIISDKATVASMTGAERLVALDVEEVSEIGSLLPMSEAVEYSSFNPPLAEPSPAQPR